MNYTLCNETVVVIDFETSGMSPEQGDRVIEIGAVLIRHGKVADSFQTLVNPGFLVSREIEMVTGINNRMLNEAPSAAAVMGDLAHFIGTHPLVAHNASFDQKFLESEFALTGKKRPFNFGCTLKIARRIYPDLPNYKLETLVKLKGLAGNGQFHRALADAEMTAALWLRIISDLGQRYGFTDIPFETLNKLGKTPYPQVDQFLQKTAEELKSAPPDTTGSLF
ncbi:DNA polymerase-3 subunit epsilon [Malonomonas rubra DSM 5091]|uniref:DNA polymerase-3 subunit epsilon n=1 Tax=Malonomonas rubra DSM 5091 TaxID=1122189 RepID=A0A1M6BV82_MALRU|nr:3'-5' exonuclease [Malonomonas rubra]SHI52513.1 DNA polymerase-3 subunit epsilon [Malonomonas rubra DSM 5091]